MRLPGLGLAGPLAAAFGLGFALGTILLRTEWEGWDVVIPPGVTAGGAGECPVGPGPVLGGWDVSTYCGPGGGTPNGEPHYRLQFGVDTWWYSYDWPPGTVYPDDWTHGRNEQYNRFPALGDVNGPVVTPRYAPRPAVVEPGLAEAIGRAIHAQPALAPAPDWGPLVGPVAPPVQLGKIVVPDAGVGNEGYEAGEPSSRPVPRPSPQPLPARPPSNVKERKVKGPLALRLLAARGVYGGITELEDAVTAVHKALDSDCLKRKGARKAGPVWDPSKRNTEDGYSWRKVWNGRYSEWRREKGAYRKPSLAEKSEVLLKHFDCVDLQQAAINLVWETIEDRIYGALGKTSRKAAERENRGPFPRGYGLGPAL